MKNKTRKNASNKLRKNASNKLRKNASSKLRKNASNKLHSRKSKPRFRKTVKRGGVNPNSTEKVEGLRDAFGELMREGESQRANLRFSREDIRKQERKAERKLREKEREEQRAISAALWAEERQERDEKRRNKLALNSVIKTANEEIRGIQRAIQSASGQGADSEAINMAEKQKQNIELVRDELKKQLKEISRSSSSAR